MTKRQALNVLAKAFGDEIRYQRTVILPLVVGASQRHAANGVSERDLLSALAAVLLDAPNDALILYNRDSMKIEIDPAT